MHSTHTRLAHLPLSLSPLTTYHVTRSPCLPGAISTDVLRHAHARPLTAGTIRIICHICCRNVHISGFLIIGIDCLCGGERVVHDCRPVISRYVIGDSVAVWLLVVGGLVGDDVCDVCGYAAIGNYYKYR